MAETTTPISQPNDREVVITRVACRTVVMTEQVTPESPVLSLEDHVTGQLRRLCAVFGLGVVTDEYTCLLGELLGPVANKSLADRAAPRRIRRRWSSSEVAGGPDRRAGPRQARVFHKFMKMRLLFTTLPALGRLHPLVAIARAAQRAGHFVAFGVAGYFVRS